MVDKFFMATKAFITFDGKVLIIREASEYEYGSNAGRHHMPGGRLKPGEEWSEALKREVKEEVGLEVDIDEPFCVSEWRPEVKDEKWQIVGVFFKCTAGSEDVDLGDEHDGYEWIDPSNYSGYDILEDLEDVFEHYNERYSE